ncbi:type 1 glutamine amidotransferase [Pedobacter cryoconitis]|uniref:GMP synthase-like glutamine amidotransferase n=1 Tax=Pedobacter cryoconitis TaxID=188932 RepID=A0A7X0J738_9SPHI|nr:GMP synthase [Pedobacter cryoconitis]MBB6502311.1 GMP synthase-like glutamine amidotransferase [Pedobacter cryoconitis]
MTAQKKEIKVAVIDMNKGVPNQGLRGILDILSSYKKEYQLDLSYKVFELRLNNEIPGTDYDIYISSGGPGSPYDGLDESWENSFFKLLDDLEDHNSKHDTKKHVFLICHSFQLACRKYGLGMVTERKSNAFGIFPVTLTEQGEDDLIYRGLSNPFYAVDSRDWQVVDAEDETFNEMGAEILAIEKERPHIDLERCIMSIRFSREFVGTQFHPEADPLGMKLYLLEEEKKKAIIDAHGEEKYLDMLDSLENPDRIMLTQQSILPNFLTEAIQALKAV